MLAGHAQDGNSYLGPSINELYIAKLLYRTEKVVSGLLLT